MVDRREERLPAPSDGFASAAEERSREAPHPPIPSTDLLAALVDSSIDAIISKDLQGHITSWNRAAEELFGYGAEEMLGQPITRLIPPDLQFEEVQIMARIMRGEAVCWFETQRLRKDGTRVVVLLSISPIRGPGGEVVGASKIARDLTDRAPVGARQRGALDAAAAGSWEAWPLEGRFAADRQALQLHGLALDEPLTDEVARATVHPADRAAVEAALREMLEWGLPFRSEHRVVWPDGTVRWVLSHAQIDADSPTPHVVGLVQDVTARKEAQVHAARHLDAVTRLQELGTLYVREGMLEPVLGKIVEAAVAISGADFGTIELLDGVSGERILVGDVETDPLHPGTAAPEVRRRAGVHAVQTTPLMSRGGQLLGMVSTHCRLPGRPDEQTLRLLDLLARQTADIIERHRTEQALRASEQRLRNVLDGMDECFGLMDRDLRILTQNATALQIDGRPLEAIRGRTHAEVYPGANPELERLYRCALAEGVPVSLEHRHEWPGGGATWLGMRAYPVPEGVAVFWRDVTERKQAQEALSEELRNTRILRELGARLVTEASAQTIYEEVLSAAIEITRARAGTVQMLDASAQELIVIARRGFSERTARYFHRVDAGSNTSCGLALRTGVRSYVDFDPASPEVPVRMHVEDGVLSAQSSPLVTRSGKPIGMVSTHWGEPGHRLSERELRFLDLLARQATDLLEQRAAEAALRESEERLRVADRQKDEFLAMLAHELRNPLAPIRNASAILSHVLPEDSTLRLPLAVIGRQTNHLSHLVDDLLDVSRIAQGRIDLELEILEAGMLLEQAIEAVQPLASEKGHRLHVHRPTSSLHVRGDRVRLVQALSNVLHNAAKYTEPRGSISVVIRAADEQLEFEVGDDGMGIPAELLPRVFDLFVQNERTLDRAQGGLGIGLSVVKHLIEMHGGAVEARSEGPGRGSTFTIRLPQVLVTRPEEVPAVSTVPIRPRRILVVDDNVDAADSLAMLLSLGGHDVEAVYGAAAALAAVEAREPDVVLLDIGMPQMDGYQVARRLRSRNTVTGMRLVAVTGYGQPTDRARAETAGFDAHLVKPMDPDALTRLFTTSGTTDPQ